MTNNGIRLRRDILHLLLKLTSFMNVEIIINAKMLCIHIFMLFFNMTYV